MIMLALLLAIAFPALAFAQTPPPTFGLADTVIVTWDASTPGSPDAPITSYEIAVTEATADLNGTAPVSSAKRLVAATANTGTDITAMLRTWGRTGRARLWVRATDGVNWSAWSPPCEVILIFIAPTPPTNLQVKKG